MNLFKEQKERIIEKEIDTICQIIKETIPSQSGLKSIIWHGGFAIREGGLYRFKERWLPYGDYDITIVSEKPIPRHLQGQIYRKILILTGYRSVVELDTEPLSEDVKTFKIVDLKFVPYYSFILRVPDISSYDLRYCSRILYGDDLRDKLKADIEDIPLVSPLRIIFNRLFTALDVFSFDFMKRQLNFMEIVALKLAITRTWLSLGMALSFYLGEYKVSYLERMKVLRKNEAHIGKDIVDRIERAVLFKISPDVSHANGEEVVKEWFLAMERADYILRLLLRRYLEIRPEESWTDISFKLFNTFLPRYYAEYIKTQFSKKFWSQVDSLWTEVVSSKIIGAWENIKLMGWRHWISRWPDIFISPEGRYFAIIPLLAFSLRSDGKVEQASLPLAKEILNPLYPHNLKENAALAWEEERKIFCSVIRKYKYSKNSARNIGNIFDRVKFWG